MSLEHWKKTFDPCIFFGVMHGLMDVGASLLGIEYTGMCNALDCVYVHSNVLGKTLQERSTVLI